MKTGSVKWSHKALCFVQDVFFYYTCVYNMCTSFCKSFFWCRLIPWSKVESLTLNSWSYFILLPVEPRTASSMLFTLVLQTSSFIVCQHFVASPVLWSPANGVTSGFKQSHFTARQKTFATAVVAPMPFLPPRLSLLRVFVFLLSLNHWVSLAAWLNLLRATELSPGHTAVQ